jgi:radical SAM protein with 4Fe4S-binding SPASM domain
VLNAKILKKIPQYTRNKRHLNSIIGHATAAKIFNLARVEMERKLRRVKISGYPYLLIIDPCNICNLRCPLCPTGTKELNRKQCKLSLEEFKSIFDKFKKYLFEAYLHNWGESLLNKDIFAMIEYAQNNNVGTNLSSNLVLTEDADIEALIDCGLEYLIVSLDAAAPEVYNQYRIGGDFDRVIENLNLLLKRRKQKKSKTPIVEWQFIVMSINQHQTAEADILAKKIGVDIMRFIPVGLPFDSPNKKQLAEKWFPADGKGQKDLFSQGQLQFSQGGRAGSCYYLYRSIVIDPDGAVAPCCAVYDQRYDFGSIWEKDVDEIWNNSFYQSARSLFSNEKIEKMEVTACDKCDFFRKNSKKC